MTEATPTRYVPGTRVRDLTGLAFGRLKVSEFAGRDKSGKARWRCECECGEGKTVLGSHLSSGAIASCGCLHREQLAERGRTHGLSRDPLYAVRNEMIQRCTNESSPDFPRYGGRRPDPITVCPDWLESFESFERDMRAGYAPGLELDRIDNERGYSKANCRWVTKAQQARNRRSNAWVEFQGARMIRADWADKLGISRPALSMRLNRGWPVERALTLGVDPARLAQVIAEHCDAQAAEYEKATASLS